MVAVIEKESKSLRTSSVSWDLKGGGAGGLEVGAPSQDMQAVTRDLLTSDPGRHG